MVPSPISSKHVLDLPASAKFKLHPLNQPFRYLLLQEMVFRPQEAFVLECQKTSRTTHSSRQVRKAKPLNYNPNHYVQANLGVSLIYLFIFFVHTEIRIPNITFCPWAPINSEVFCRCSYVQMEETCVLEVTTMDN